MIYTILTSAIILISKLRKKLSPPLYWRFDRTLPWPKGQPASGLWMSCCDCGLAHFFITGESGTPVRPEKYAYRLRFGATGHTEPDLHLGRRAAASLDRFFEQVEESKPAHGGKSEGK